MFLRPEIASTLSDEDLDQILDSPQGMQVRNMLKYTAIGTAQETGDWAERFARETGADEIIVTHQAADVSERIQSVELFGEAMREK